jgi:AGCS family alanine or glycine:cation symporter
MFACLILLHYSAVLRSMIGLILSCALSPAAAFGGFAGASVMSAMRYGIYRGIFITESGLGTASIPHALAQVKRPTDQAIIAMGSTIAEIFLAVLSGLLVIVTGIWAQGAFRCTLVYEIFKDFSPIAGRFVLLSSITLFVITTVMGNSFNGLQAFAWLTNGRYKIFYQLILLSCIVGGSHITSILLWEVMDTLLTLVAIPHLLGLVVLTMQQPERIKWQ